ncbi:hypothetical protein BD769DRAFT_1682236 [Suillus cothurnatus]|nr:hypothetical protein BD769DRAFT_1682236 [Suillus cothurnatus]
MATIAFDNSVSGISDPPPSYDAIYMFDSMDSIRYKRSAFSFLQFKRQKRCRASVLSRIHDIVSSPDFTLFSVAPILESCAAALPAGEFSDLLQKLSIEDHTALYWAIVNNRQEALLEFIKFIPKFSPACSSDLRLACMTVSDHNSFMLLNLGKMLIRMMWAKITSLFIVFRMFQKRLRITQKLEVEFVARGRIWLLRFYMGKKGKWWIEYLLSEHSSPVHADTELQIQANKSPPGSGTPQHHSFYMYRSRTLVPEK